MINEQTVVTPCSGHACVAITAIGGDWFRVFSTVLPSIQVAVTGDELRAWIAAAKNGAFDDLARRA